MSDLAMSRRAVTRAIVTLPTLAAAPIAVAETSQPPSESDFDRTYNAFVGARNALDGVPGTISEAEEDRLGDIYMRRFHQMNEAKPANARDFARKFYALWARGGCPNERIIESMIADAQSLIQNYPA